jgi:UDP-2,3-diacylglucosamine hydrolase
VAVYITSDVHLRLDCPERGRCFARWVERLEPGDALVVAGDLCDFWFASRQRAADPWACPGLRALAEFRSRGGALTLLAGNHDAALGPLFEASLGARFVPEPLVFEAFGLRVHLVHGHRLGARRAWKGALESHAFLQAFGRIPTPLARGLEALLIRSNARGRSASDGRHLAAYRRYAARCAGTADLVVFGHVHHPLDDAAAQPRLVVLGSWHRGPSFLKIDAGTIALSAQR